MEGEHVFPNLVKNLNLFLFGFCEGPGGYCCEREAALPVLMGTCVFINTARF